MNTTSSGPQSLGSSPHSLIYSGPDFTSSCYTTALFNSSNSEKIVSNNNFYNNGNFDISSIEWA